MISLTENEINYFIRHFEIAVELTMAIQDITLLCKITEITEKYPRI